jgi:hypothetical protein
MWACYEISWPKLVAVATCSATWVFAYAARYDFLILAIRLPDSSAIQGSLPLYLFTSYFVRPAVVISFFVALMKLRDDSVATWQSRVLVGYLFALALATNFPTSQARFYVFAVLVCGLMVLLPRIAVRAQAVNALLILSMVGSSVFHLFRAGRVAYDWRERFDFLYLHEGHFSSFSNFTHLVDYVHQHGIRWGEQLLGSVLFWMPRALWPDKPIGTAELIVREYLQWQHGLVFSNIAMPALGEFFIDFHIPGVVLGAAALATLSANIDRVYRVHSATPRLALPSILIASFLTGLWLFINRGDFQSAFAYSTGISVAILAVVHLTSRRRV